MVKQYRKLPVVIEAMKLEVDNITLVYKWIHDKFDIKTDLDMIQWHEFCDFIVPKYGLPIETLEGTMYASIGDYIIKGINGEFYPCKPDIFAKTYEEVTE